ncbi:MAG: PAS domain S-box protein [Chitinophagaceae bacterium]|nr:MAG: PAS domain S-box protein [Chitinophagaceae bacterium]
MFKRFQLSYFLSLTYLFFGLIWIYFSDRFLLSIVETDNGELITTLQSYKGYGFVLVSTLVLFVLSDYLTKTLRESKKSYEDLFKLNPLYTWLVDQNTNKILLCNDAAIEKYGYTKEEFKQLHYDEIVYESDLYNQTETHLQKDGSKSHVEVITKPAQYENKEVLIVIAKDITEKLELNKRIKDKNVELAKFKNAISNSSLVSICDEKGIITEANKKFADVSKYSLEELIGKPYNILNSGYHDKSFFKDLWTTISSGKAWRGEICNRTKDGEIYWVDTNIFPFVNKEGKIYEYLSIRNEITEKKEFQEKLLKINKKLDAEVIQRTKELQMANENLKSFNSSLSFDLQKPIVESIKNLESLNKNISDKLNEKDKSDIKNVFYFLNNAQAQILNLMAFSIMGNHEKRIQNLDMNKIVNNALSELKATEFRFSEHKIDVKDLPEGLGDEKMIDQVVRVLLSNALKFSAKKENPIIEVGCYINQENSECIYFLKDNGIGIEKSNQDKIFNGIISKTEQENFSGNGVGLAIADRIIMRHGGKIWLESEINEGSTFYFSLPCVE